MDIAALHTLANGIIIGVCMAISFGLAGFRQMARAVNPKYRHACYFFIAASFTIAIGHLAELLIAGFEYQSLDLFSILVLVLASSQALMFTFMLILLFDSKYVTPTNVLKYASPSLFFILLYVVSCCVEADVSVYSFAEWRTSVTHNLPLAVRTLFGVAYTVQLLVYIELFFRKKRHYVIHLKQLPQEHVSELELRWTTRAFLYALAVGIGAWILLVCPGVVPEFFFGLLIVVFYPAFAWLYANFHYTYDLLRRIIINQDEKLPQPPPEADMEDLIHYLQTEDTNHLFEELQVYLQKEQPHLNSCFNRTDLLKALGTNERNLSAAIGRATGLTTQDFLLRLRIRHAMDVLLLPDYMYRTIEDIAESSGFKSMRTFNRNFRELVKMSPSEFRQQKSNFCQQKTNFS